MRKLVISFFLLLFSAMSSFHGQAQTSKIDSLLEVLPRLHGADLADASLDLADAYLYLTPEKTIEYGEKALDLLVDSDRPNQLCYAKLLIGTGYIAIGEFNKGEEFITPALSLARKIKNAKYISIGLSALAAFHMNTGNYAKAMELFKETLEKATQAGLPDWEARAKLNIGSLLTNQGDRAGGLRYMTEALVYFESSGNAPVVARIMNNIAVNYHAWRDYDLALKYYRKTLRAYEISGDLLGKVVVLNNIGEIYKDKGQYDMALQYYDQIFDLAENNSISDFYLALGWVGLAETYLLKGDNTLGRNYANQSLHVFETLGMKEGEINAKLILSQVNMHENKLDRANEIVDACLIEAKAIGLKELIQKAYLLKSEILQKQKDDSGALENYKKYVAIADSLKLEKQTHQLALHRAELDISEKENEIELLQKDNEIKDLQLVRQKSQSRTFIVAIALLLALVGVSLSYNKARNRANDLLQQKNNQIIEQHEELVRVNQTKDKFLSIIGHDLRNPIGAFKDMVSQLAEFPEMFDEELRNQILEELRDEAESTYFLLDNLLLWAKTQKNSIQFKPEKLKLNLVIKNNIILNSRIATRKKIEMKASVPDEVLVYADHNMVDLVVRNLLSNALKFTPENGKVDIHVSSLDANFIEVSIKDTGVGIAEGDLPRLLDPNDHLSTYGTGNEKGSGLGLVLCREFIEMNGGKLAIHSQVGHGSTFSFTLKKYRVQQA